MSDGAMALSTGTRLGPYEIRSLLGAGGMGEVYLAHDTRLGRDVALKVLPPAVAATAGAAARLEREARAAAALNHPNIVTLYSIEEAIGVRFLTMECVEGESLSEYLSRTRPPLATLLAIAEAIAGALAAAHEKGIIHRDLKPANVMMTRDGRVKVLDFGLAKLLTATEAGESTEAANLATTQAALGAPLTGAPVPAAPEAGAPAPVTGAHAVLGTVPYMAPEQLRGETADARTDLFSCGVVLYELATGRRPFAGASSVEVGAAILRDQPTPLSHLRSDLPPEFGRIVSRCLEKDPVLRFASAHELLAALDALRHGHEIAAAAALPAPFPADMPSIAVLPFVSLGRAEENEYFAEGLSEELLNVLAKVRNLRVASRTSAFRFKGKERDLAVVAQRLKVATILDGTVRKAGKRVRITVQLTHVATDSLLWSATYDRELDDIFAVEDDIAQTVVKELRVTLLGAESDTAVKAEVKADIAAASLGRATDAKSYRLYLQGRFFMQRRTHEDLTRGIGYIRRALTLDPEYALGWALVSRAYGTETNLGWVPFAEGRARAREAAERALALAPGLAEGHMALGQCHMLHDWDWPAADRAFRRALELAPGNADVVRGAGHLAWVRGRIEEAIALGQRATALDPLSAGAHDDLGNSYYYGSRLEEAEEAFRMAAELRPQAIGTSSSLGLVYLAQGRLDEARAVFEREPDHGYRLHGLVLVEHACGRQAESDAALAELIATHTGDCAYQIAQAAAYRGEADRAFSWLERAYSMHDSGMTELKSDPLLNNLHADPRWLPFLAKMGF